MDHCELMELLAVALNKGTEEQVRDAVDLALYSVASSMGFKGFWRQPKEVAPTEHGKDRLKEIHESLARKKSAKEAATAAEKTAPATEVFGDGAPVLSGPSIYPVSLERIEELDPHNIRQYVAKGYPKEGSFSVTELLRGVMGDKFNMRCSVSFAQSFAWLVRSGILEEYRCKKVNSRNNRYHSCTFPAAAQRCMYWATHAAGIAKLVGTESVPLRSRFSLMEFCDWAHINGNTAKLYKIVSKFQTVDDEFVYNEATLNRLESSVRQLELDFLPLRKYDGRIK